MWQPMVNGITAEILGGKNEKFNNKLTEVNKTTSLIKKNKHNKFYKQMNSS